MLVTTLLQRSALAVVLGTGVVTPGVVSTLRSTTTSHHQAVVIGTRSAKTQVIHYHLRLTRRDSSGGYDWAGEVDGFVNGHATVTLRYQDAAPNRPGAFPIETHWHLKGATDSESLEATLSGVLTLPSGKTHLIGAIIGGAGRGREVETRSQITNLGVADTMSDCDGTITIFPPVEEQANNPRQAAAQ